jgi:hypothetical protein
MRADKDRLYSADVVAMFENQDDADEAVLQLRLLGLPNDHIGYFAQHPERGWMDLIDHNLEYIVGLIGGIVGAVLCVWLARVIDGWSRQADAVTDSFGLAVTLGTCGALFGSFLGWWIGTGIELRSVRAPAIDPAIGSFILAVSAGELRDRAWTVIHDHGGHELPPGAERPQSIAV